MPTVNVSTETVDEMPEVKYGRDGRWTEDIKAAIEDGKVRCTKPRDEKGNALSKKELDTIRRALAHTANGMGKGLSSTVKDGDIYWKITTKRTRNTGGGGTEASGSVEGGTGTPTAAAPAPESSDSGAVPSAEAGKATGRTRKAS